MMTIELYRKENGGYGWLLFQDKNCVGSSEIAALSAERALAAAKRWAKKYDYGEVDKVRIR
jgi:hypothetical protein